METLWWTYVEQLVIFGLFVWACRQLWRQFRPNTAGGCSKGCGDACPASRLQDRLAEAEAQWQQEQ